MALNDTLANVLSQLNNAIQVGKTQVVTNTSSKVITTVLQLMKSNGYIGDVEEVEDSKGNYYKITLVGKLNKCGVVKPRFAVKLEDFEKYERRFLPARGFGFLFVSTNKGILTHVQAKEQGVGGRLLGFCY
ncbi:MAG: 30S ribosomal protein S8 [Candidatus Nanoarchaeia archaeon]